MRRKLTEEIKLLGGVYPQEAVNMVLEHIELLIPIQESWLVAFDKALSAYGIVGAADAPASLQQQTLSSVHLPKNRTCVLGFCGPGATGKETVARALEAPKVINTTTRTQRSYETDGVQYHFVTDEAFRKMSDRGDFVFSHEKAGRGWYGIQKADLESVLNGSSLAVIEESPATLRMLQAGIQRDIQDVAFLAVYLLPPSPVLPHLACRLAVRCFSSGDSYEPVILSTLGKRQVDEFESTISLKEEGMPLVYIVNDDVSAATARIRSIL